MKKILVTLLAVFASLVLKAQYGYLGKSVYLDYNVHSSLIIYNPVFKDEPNILQQLFNFNHEISLHKVLNRKREVYGFYNYGRSAFDVNDNVNGSFFSSGDNNKLALHTFGAGFRFYHSGVRNKKLSIAPLGKYFDFKPYIMSLVTSYKENKEAELQKVRRLTSLGLTLGFGRQTVWFDRVTINYGLELGMPLDGFFAIRTELSNVTPDLNPTEIYNQQAWLRVSTRSIFGFKVGIGLLAL